MKKKNTLYRAYLEKKQESKNNKELLKKYNISNDNNIVIIDKSRTKFITIIASVIGKVLKLVMYLLFLVLSSLGATVLINEELRNIAVSMF